MEFITLIVGLASELHIPDLLPDTENHCSLLFGDIHIDLFYLENNYVVMSGSAGFININEVTLAYQLLAENLSGNDKLGITFSLSNENELILFYKQKLETMSFSQTNDGLALLVAYIKHWQTVLIQQRDCNSAETILRKF